MNIALVKRALMLLVLVGLVALAGCQGGVKYQLVSDVNSLPERLIGIAEDIMGGYFSPAPGYFVYTTDQDTYVLIQESRQLTKVKSVRLAESTLTVRVALGAQQPDYRQHTLLVKGKFDAVRVLDDSNGLELQDLTYTELLKGLRGTFISSDREAGKVAVQVDRDIAWPGNEKPTTFLVLAKPIMIELEKLAPGYHRLRFDALRDKQGNLHLARPEVEPVTPPTFNVAFERYPAYYEPATARGVVFRPFGKAVMEEPKHTVVIAYRGECPSTGYGIRIDKIVANGEGYFDVHVRHLDPEPGSMQSEVLTYPADTVIIEGTSKDWRFRLVTDGVTKGPHKPESVSFTPYNYTPESMPDELGVHILPLVAQTDFNDTAISVHREKCPTTGYGVKITRITRDIDGVVTVYVKLTNPPKGSIQAQVITQPVDTVRIAGWRANWTYKVIVE